MQELETQNQLDASQRLNYLADFYQGQMDAYAHRADSLAEQAAAVGDFNRQESIQKTADQLREWSAERANSSDSYAWMNKWAGATNSVADGLGKAGGVFEAWNASEAAVQAVNGNWHEAGRLISGSLGGIAAGAAIASVGAVAALPGLAAATLIVGGALLAGEAAKWLWDNIDNFEIWMMEHLGLENSFAVNPDMNLSYQQANEFVRRVDPLVLDLDGDGLETVGANSSVLFDHDGDGVQHGTGWAGLGWAGLGWAGADDGLLVFDRNGNGAIDTGAELFGADTLLTDGTKAENGYQALAELDSNGDGKVDSSDAEFAALQVWQDANQDANQDGISQDSELLSLSEAGIASIATDFVASSSADGNGNVKVGGGSYTKLDGTTGATGSFDFAENNFYRQFTDAIEIREELDDLPDMQGSGGVRDLKDAAALNSDLAELLTEYASAETRETQEQLLDGLIESWWAASSDYQHFVKRLDSADFNGRDVQFRIKEPEENSSGSSGGGFLVAEDSNSSTSSGFYESLLDGSELAVGRFAGDQTLETMAKIKVLEVFNHQDFFSFDFDETSEETVLRTRTGAMNQSFRAALVGDVTITNAMFSFEQGQVDLIDQAYQQLKSSVYAALVGQTRFAKYKESIGFEAGTDGSFDLSFDQLNNLWESELATGGLSSKLDFFEFFGIQGEALVEQGWQWGQSKAAELLSVSNSSDKAEITSVFKSVAGLTGAVISLGTAANETIQGGEKADLLFGSDGADRLYGYGGNDTLEGGVDNDRDYLYGGGGDDLLLSGQGGDYLHGDAGNDTYLYQSGTGWNYIKQKGTAGADAIITRKSEK